MSYHKFSRTDLRYTFITGFYTGVIIWRVAEYLRLAPIAGLPYLSLALFLPLLWIAGVWLGYALGRWLAFFNQFGKFAAIGFTNFAVDLGSLNLLLALTGYTRGNGYGLIRTIAAVVAVSHSYYWNRRWVFASQRADVGREFGSFAAAAAIAAAINVGTAWLIVTFVNPVAGLTPEHWANAAAVLGSAVALAVNFVILRRKVFNKGRE